MAYKFKAIEQDKENLKPKESQRTIISNAAFGSDERGDITPQKIVEKVIQLHSVPRISLDLIRPREVNDFDMISTWSLKISINNVGVIQPIVLRTDEDGKYTIISGHRRFYASKELVADLKIRKAEAEKAGTDTAEIDRKIESVSNIPAVIFTVVSSNSDLLGTDPKYITKEMEEEMYRGSNMETRQISKKDLTKHITYFYNLISNNAEYKERLLEDRNKGAKRKATKLNLPDVLSKIVTKDLGFQVSSAHIWRLVTIIENEEQYPKYYKIAMKRIEDGEKVKTVFEDFRMAVEIWNYPFESQAERDEYIIRLERGSEKVADIYNELMNIRPDSEKKKAATVSKEFAEKLIKDLANRSITLEEALKMIENA